MYHLVMTLVHQNTENTDGNLEKLGRNKCATNINKRHPDLLSQLTTTLIGISDGH